MSSSYCGRHLIPKVCTAFIFFKKLPSWHFLLNQKNNDSNFYEIKDRFLKIELRPLKNCKMTITIYHFPLSAPSRTALLTARVLGLDVTVKEINLFEKEQLQPDFLKINPQHTVPTVDDNGFILWESRAIASYLARQYGKDDSLYPQNPQLQAVVDQRLYFDCCTLYPRIRNICFPVLFLGETKVTEDKKKSLNEAIALIEKFLHGKKFLIGDTCTIADISTYASVSSALALGWDINSFPNVKSWIERCKALPGSNENDEGAAKFGQAVLKNLDPGQI